MQSPEKPPKATPQEIIEEENLNEPPLMPSTRPRAGGSVPFNFGSNTTKMLLIAILVPVVLIFMLLPVMGGGNFVLKKDFETNIGNIAATINQTKAVAEKTQSDLNREIQNIPSTITTAMSQSVTSFNQQISTLSNQVNNFNTNLQNNTNKINELTTALNNVNLNLANSQQETANLKKAVQDYAVKVETLNTTVVALEKRIVELEKKQTVVQPSKAVTAQVKTISSSLIASSNTTMSGSIRIELTNNTNVAVKDIVLEVSIMTDMIQGYQSSTLAGASTIWQGQGIPWNMINFMNTQWGLNLAANETKVLYLTYTVTGTGFIPIYQTYGVPFQVDVNVM